MILLLAAVLEIQHLANAGILLRCGDDAAIVDGAFNEGVWRLALCGIKYQGQVQGAGLGNISLDIFRESL